MGTPEIAKWLQHRTFEHRSALGPSQNCLREGFWKKREKSMRNTMENDRFWDAITFQNYALCDEFMTFRFSEMLKNRCQKGPEKLWFKVQNRPLGVEGSIYSPFWIDFGRIEKTWIFQNHSEVQKINKNRPSGHQGPKRDQRGELQWRIAVTDETPGRG